MKIKIKNAAIMFCVALLISTSLANLGNAQNPSIIKTMVEDVHSYSNPQAVRVRHVDLDWNVLFDKKILQGTATLSFERTSDAQEAPLILDTRDLLVAKAETSEDGKTYKTAEFKIGENDKILGAPLTIQLPKDAKFVRIYYSTSQSASGLQWLEPQQTAGK
ncbi:MAG: hypothetical protein M3Q33_13775, partial [Acidobacteriota bacterium]|nr:hypothetical protein [Acidobacteriota bacterium]